MEYKFIGLVEHDSSKINLYYNHIKVPIKIHSAFKKEKIKRVMIQLNGQESFHGGFIPVGDGRYFIITSKQVLKKNNLEIGDKPEVKIWPDTSKYGMSICEEMKELLEQDDEGSKVFHSLTDGKIRSLLFKVNNYKSSDKRLEKGVIVLDHLKANDGKLDWKMLNEAFKQGLKF